MDDDDDDELSSQDGGPAVPAGVLPTSKKGWAGEELEIQHRIDHNPKEDFAAVEITQFQNTEVGAGYQARGVVRQKTAGAAQNTPVRDWTGKTQGSTNPVAGGDSTEPKLPKEIKRKKNKRKRLEEYISCDGIREFRKEIEQLLASASSR